MGKGETSFVLMRTCTEILGFFSFSNGFFMRNTTATPCLKIQALSNCIAECLIPRMFKEVQPSDLDRGRGMTDTGGSYACTRRGKSYS